METTIGIILGAVIVVAALLIYRQGERKQERYEQKTINRTNKMLSNEENGHPEKTEK